MAINEKRFIGCCGAYCKTCKALVEGVCKGCKLGYEEGKRDINKSKCAIKLCCFKDKKLETCADCSELNTCKIINKLYNHKGYKYKRYKESIDYIRKNGYSKFIKASKGWNGAYGKLE